MDYPAGRPAENKDGRGAEEKLLRKSERFSIFFPLHSIRRRRRRRSGEPVIHKEGSGGRYYKGEKVEEILLCSAYYGPANKLYGRMQIFARTHIS